MNSPFWNSNVTPIEPFSLDGSAGFGAIGGMKNAAVPKKRFSAPPVYWTSRLRM